MASRDDLHLEINPFGRGGRIRIRTRSLASRTPASSSTPAMSGPGVCICNSDHKAITWRDESHTHLSKQTRPSTDHSRKASNVRGIPSRPEDQLRWVLIILSQV